jgi:PadR family transcriptional regulator AphA
MELNQTSYVLLGTLSFGPRTGYSIKTLLDKSTRFFWAISYGQIYPELKRLAEGGLVDRRDTTEGGRKKIEYTITEAGREALQAWLKQPPQTFELRDEGLLKLFFSGAGSPEDAIRALATVRERRERLQAELLKLEAAADALQPGNPYPAIVLRAGVEFFQFFTDWCAKTEHELSSAGEGTTPQTTDPTERTPDV